MDKNYGGIGPSLPTGDANLRDVQSVAVDFDELARRWMGGVNLCNTVCSHDHENAEYNSNRHYRSSHNAISPFAETEHSAHQSSSGHSPNIECPQTDIRIVLGALYLKLRRDIG